ncbi:hypothetical protein KY326_03960, partial [Candidatus Woesearchaeota archaeon]|nr:hypothetical protein [Candidatus Woesearchaeota archaeon]
MNEAIKKDLLLVISSSLLALEKQEFFKLDNVSDQCLQSAALYHDEDVINLAIIIYSLSKISARNQIKPIANWNKIMESIHALLVSARHNLNRNHLDSFRADLKEILNKIAKADEKIGMYIDKVLHKARIKKGRKIYEQGLSIGETSELIGVNYWDL